MPPTRGTPEHGRLDAVATRFRRFADEEATPDAPRYAALARAVAADAALRAFVAHLPDSQPNLLLAAVHALAGTERMPREGAELARFLDEHGDEVTRLVATRRVQTNEVGRCAAILPALPPGRLALLEVGASAGLNLLLDRFAYAYGERTLGGSGARVRLAPRTSGPLPVPRALPEIVWRRGVDLAPVDVHDDDAVRWLRACVWADAPERIARLEAAVAEARQDPAPVERGDLVEALPRLVRAAPEGARLVVLHAGVLPYLPADRREAFHARLDQLAAERPLTWVSFESPGVVHPGVPAALEARPVRFLVCRADTVAGRLGAPELLALAHPHGADVQWLDPEEVRTARRA